MTYNKQLCELNANAKYLHAQNICPTTEHNLFTYLLSYRLQYWLDGFGVEHGHF